MSEQLRGVMSALVTPFTEDGSAVDETALRTLVRAQIADGVAGLVAAGGTGEFWTLSFDERRQVNAIVANEASGQVPVVAQTGGLSTTQAIELSVHAQQEGADVLMLAVPYYEPLSFEQAAEYYVDVAKETDLPLMAYNYPHASGLHMTADFVLQLAAEIPSLQYLKDSCGDAAQLELLTADHPDEITVFNGEDSLLVHGLLIGVPGMIMGLPNFLTPGLVQAYEAARAGDFGRAINIWQGTRPVIRAISQGGYPAAMKAALELCGLPGGPVRAPFRSFTQEQRDVLEKALRGVDPDFLTSGRAS